MDLWERTRASMRGSWKSFGDDVPEAEWAQTGGVAALVYPPAPNRSVFNAVVDYQHGAVEREYDRLSALYDDAGIVAWTVWVPEHDRGTAAFLESRGHRLDAEPANMIIDLREFHSPDPPADVDWDVGATVEEWAAVNEAAYPWRDGSMEQAILAFGEVSIPVYRVREDGRAVAVVGAEDHGDDCYISLVATLPEARGKGYSYLLMNEALRDARARGCTTSSLQATKKGEPVYTRVGFHSIGAFQMWERRKG